MAPDDGGALPRADGRRMGLAVAGPRRALVCSRVRVGNRVRDRVRDRVCGRRRDRGLSSPLLECVAAVRAAARAVRLPISAHLGCRHVRTRAFDYRLEENLRGRF